MATIHKEGTKICKWFQIPVTLGIYKRKISKEKVRKHAFVQEKKENTRKQERNTTLLI